MKNIKHGIYADNYQPLEKQEAMSLLRHAAQAMKTGYPSEVELRAHAAVLVKLTKEFPNADIDLREDLTSERVFHSAELHLAQYD